MGKTTHVVFQEWFLVAHCLGNAGFGIRDTVVHGLGWLRQQPPGGASRLTSPDVATWGLLYFRGVVTGRAA